MSEYSHLFAKAEGVHDMVKFLEKKIREFDETHDKNLFYDSIERATLISIKISAEKYEKKLKHQAQERINSDNDE